MHPDDEAATAGGADGGGGAAPALDGDLMQAVAGGELQEQLAGATQLLQEQLMSITQEMNRLKSEIYSEQGSLNDRLGELTAAAAGLDPGAGAEQRGGGTLGSCSNASSSGAQQLRSRPPPARKASSEPRPTPRARETDRRVEFAPGTRDPVPMRDRYMGRAPMQPPPQPWAPYIVGFVLLCIGPLRPIVWELLSTLWSWLSQQLWGGAVEEELAWYDA